MPLSIVAVTCAATGLLVAAHVPAGHFAHIVVDESGQAMEPELLVPLSLAGPHTTVVLAGDHCQLGPSIRSPVAIREGLGQSLQERLMTALQDPEDCPPLLQTEGAGTDRARCRRRSPAEFGVLIGSCVGDVAVRSVMLRRNYRSHPSMLFLPSKFFYHNQLIATADTAETQLVLGWRELANPDFPIMFGTHATAQIRFGK